MRRISLTSISRKYSSSSPVPLSSKLLIACCIFGLFYFHCKSRNSPILTLNNQNLQIKATEPDLFSGTIKWADTDPVVLEYIRKNHIFLPPTEPYKINYSLEALANPENLKRLINAIGSNKSSGFFVECGANDGVFLTNTFYLEYKKKWQGLLIESSPSIFQKLRKTNRKAYTSNICLSGVLEKIEFLKSAKQDHDWRVGNGKINPGKKYKKPKKWGNELFKIEDYISEGMVECFPLISVLFAINVTTVDFFSLDVEGHEYKILKAIPFDKIDIKVLYVEHWLAPEGKEAISSLMLSHNYSIVYESESDFIFKKVE